jgi:hypothetical protein
MREYQSPDNLNLRLRVIWLRRMGSAELEKDAPPSLLDFATGKKYYNSRIFIRLFHGGYS